MQLSREATYNGAYSIPTVQAGRALWGFLVCFQLVGVHVCMVNVLILTFKDTEACRYENSDVLDDDGLA